MNIRPWFVALVCCLLLWGQGVRGEDSLEARFRAPPDAARPWVYWFWMAGNITREGITADLEAMREVGIGGCLIMHVKLGDIGNYKLGEMPPDGPVVFMSDEFRELFQHALREADRLGMKIDMNNADGFTGSGGPWVPVERSMKKLVWTETHVHGGERLSVLLPQPETVLDFYREVAVVAFPRQQSLGEQMKAGGATFSSPASKFDPAWLLDGNPRTRAVLRPQGPDRPPRLLCSFSRPYTADTLVLRAASVGRGAPVATLEVSDDGTTFRRVGKLSLKWYPAAASNTIRFDACTARYFRLSFDPRAAHVAVGEVSLGRSNKVHYWEPKAGFTRYGEWGGGAGLYTDRKITATGGPDAKNSPRSATGTEAIPAGKVFDLSASMNQGGRLAWQAPEGEWTILRIGYTSTGIKNHPASKGGHGLECDKLRAEGAEAAFDGMLKKLIADSGPLGGRSFSHAHIDSWEVGIQNWTEGMAEAFKARNGYDLTPFYPLLVAGHAVQSNDASERFLWDLRRTLLGMMADNYLGRMQSLCHEHGLKFSSEAGGRQTFLHNPVYLLTRSDLPMGEFWPHEGVPRVDCKAAASVAHLYGKPMAGAESFTGAATFANWQSHPYRLKRIGDEAFCLGINHFIIHYCVHQAYDRFQPGMAMGPWGIHLDRRNTWWEQGKPWLEYLARCQYLLRQGRFVADVLYFPAQDAPHYFGRRESLSVPLPAGYDYDGCDRETLLNRLAVKDGRLVLPDGISYRYLMLSDSRTMTPELARRIRQLVEAGAKVIAPKPRRSPSLRDFPQCDGVVQRIADDLWDSGRVTWGKTFEEIAKADRLPPDFAFAPAGAEVRYVHRRLETTDIYFVANGREQPARLVATFRVGGKRPELWRPQSGEITFPAIYHEVAGGTSLPLDLEPLESVFVVFRSPLPRKRILDVRRNGKPLPTVTETPPPPTAGEEAAESARPPVVLTEGKGGGVRAEFFANGDYRWKISDGTRREIAIDSIPHVRELAGPWTLHFPPGWGAPERVRLEKLISWTEHEDFGVQHFAGTATYEKTFELGDKPAGDGLQRRTYLDLGSVQVIAEVRLNGREMGTLWKPPFRVDISEALQPAENRLEICVTNLWPNRLIGDEQFPDDAAWNGKYLASWPQWFLQGKPRPEPRRKTLAVVKHYHKNSPLLPSGLLGPVTLHGSVVREETP